MSKLQKFPCELPECILDDSVDPAAIALQFETQLPSLAAHNFTTKPVWRDMFALTGTLRTFYSSSILVAWKDNVSRTQAHSFQAKPELCRILRIAANTQWVDAFYSFETKGVPPAQCTAILSLVRDSDGSWKIWTVRTILDQLSGLNNVDFMEPFDHTTESKISSNPSTVECVVIGGGQAGLSVAGRLKTLGVSYVVIEKNAEVGDNWKSRYRSARLHTTRQYAHLPFDRTFPTGKYQEFLTKDDLAKGYQDWTSKYGINIRLSTKLVSASWDDGKQSWTLTLESSDRQFNICCRFLVMAVGAGGQEPFMPTYSNRDSFKGITIHSSAYYDSKEWSGKHGIIVGTANTGHDVAEDMLDAGLASVTMIQRSPTYVLPGEHWKKIQDQTYNDATSTELADMLGNSHPFAVSRKVSQKVLHAIARQEPERFDALEKAGFRTIQYGDMMYQLYERFGGHYMDVGCSKKIASGLIKVKSDALPVSYTETGLLFSDGTHLEADVIVFATGFQTDLKAQRRDVLGPAITDGLDDYWGFDDEGEIRGAFKLCGHPALWFHGGTIGGARYYSRFIALQIKAAAMRTPFEIYSKTPSSLESGI